MIMTAITFLAAILVDFTFETQINKIKVTNVQDKMQARLNAEAGLRLALARLKLYKEARNLLVENKDAAKLVKGETLNSIWNLPFIYPIPIGPKANAIQKSALEDFKKNSLLQGQLRVLTANASNLINLNLLRISKFKNTKGVSNPQSRPTPDSSQNNEDDLISDVEKRLTELVKGAIDSEKEKDEEFSARYDDIDPDFLVKVIKFYVSDKDSYDEPEVGEISALFNADDITPKHAPLSSLSELYLLPKWEDAIVDVIKNQVTVHGDVNIDVNKITDKTLAIIFPALTPEQRKEFFDWRDDPDDKQYFESVDDFRRYFVTNTGFINGQQFDERINEFKKAGIKFGTAATLFKVTAEGEYNRAKSTITAYVTLPPKPRPTPTPTPEPPPSDLNPDEPPLDPTPSPTPNANASPVPTKLLDPRVVEISVN